MDRIEQDRGPAPNGDDLPTYDDLAAQEGPNSRFGRWRGWIEKRAAERYMAITPEERARRRERGWGNEEMDTLDPEPPTPGPTTPTAARLSIQTRDLRYSTLSEPPPDSPLPPLPAVSTRLRPTHLKMNHFGSRFLPHSTVPIRCHDDGLSVLEMFPQEWNDAGGLDLKGPDDAKVRPIWEGETVYQMSILELDNASGVVLMLVGPQTESPAGSDSQRMIRMYNLGSLISLAKWTIAKASLPQQTTPKRHRPTNSIARGLKSLIPPAGTQNEQGQSYQTLLSPASSISAPKPPPKRAMSDESTWEVVEDLPLRWARDFVPLASAGSRLLGASVLSFALWNRAEGERHGSRGQFLAVATKSNILLYETPPNERAFRFVKEFYTPLQPKSITFFQQTAQELGRSLSDVDPHIRHRRTGSGGGGVRGSSISAPKTLLNYGTQLCIFAIFEKKAGWIRIADSAAGEMELFDDGGYGSRESLHTRMPSSSNSSPASKQGGARWVPPVRAELPSRSVYVLTRGTTTHVVPCPAPSSAHGAAPLAVVTWRVAPGYVAARVGGTPGVLQLTALGMGFVEVAEVSLAALHGNAHGKSKGKGKARAEDVVMVRGEEDAGGETGFLCRGGHWDYAQDSDGYPVGPAMLQRMYSTGSDMSGTTATSQDMADRLKMEQGIYGWCRKGVADWRVFWLGGSFVDEDDSDEEGL
ncbi:hypothetical protein FB45DRAFT_1110822 [Roridomyces roridus]|uniref:Uncharacterized protein n=1 Tax=Roridomyces roridus TaxID=1738132 RepID=A0AAD7B8K3_9AGAR|nr:hypothetical protein FB45DRAFT_1110822 [Roridomyces roridus]